MSDAATRAIESAFTDEWGRIVAGLIRRTGDWDLAEDCAQQAFAEAARCWPRDGIPGRPGAWLTTVARNRAFDRLRHERMKAERLHAEATMHERTDPSDWEDPLAGEDESGIEDDRLRLMFTCCHPALALESRVALTLRTLAGLSTAEIARALFVPESTMAKRLVRAKHKIAHAGIPYRVPSERLLPARISGILAVLYLLFNEGYTASAGPDLVRVDLADEAIRLARALTVLMPAEPEPSGLYALMLFQHSRRLARVDQSGDLVTLEEQDRSRWDHAAIDQANAVLERSLLGGTAGPYQLQAAIAGCHANAAIAAATDWQQITTLYERLVKVMPHPVVALNQSVAIAMATGPEAGLAALEQIDASGALQDYHLLHATRADLFRRLGRYAEAEASYRRALNCRPSDAERRYLMRRLQEVAISIGG